MVNSPNEVEVMEKDRFDELRKRTPPTFEEEEDRLEERERRERERRRFDIVLISKRDGGKGSSWLEVNLDLKSRRTKLTRRSRLWSFVHLRRFFLFVV